MATDANKTTAQLVEAALPHMINSVMNIMQINGNWMNTENNRKIASEMVRNSLQYFVQLLEERDALTALTLDQCGVETHDDGIEIPIPTRVRMMAMGALHPSPPVQPVARGPIALKPCTCTDAVFTCVKCNGQPDDMIKIYAAAKTWYANGERPHGQYKAWSSKINNALLSAIASVLEEQTT